jgi:hypothetical protein
MAMPHLRHGGTAAPSTRPRRHLLPVAVLLALLVPVGASWAQVTETASAVGSAALSFGLDTEVGVLSFENEDGSGERYLSSVLAPTFEAGPWSGGLRLLCRWNQDGRRQEDYDTASDFLSAVRFVQYSEKQAQGYHARLGDIDRAELGFGQFVSRYRNTLSLDNPETGLILDRTENSYQIEGVCSNLAAPRVYGVRAAYQPFLADSTHRFQRASFGVTLAGDLSKEARLVNPHRNGLPFLEGKAPLAADSLGLGGADGVFPLTMAGLDAAAPIRTDRLDDLLAYGELGHILGYGSGLGLGIQAEHKIRGVHLKGWIEQRLLGRKYIPSYFNSRYERDRFEPVVVTLADGAELEAVNTKRNELYSRDAVELGSYVGIDVRFTRYYRLRCTFEHSWTRGESGWFEFEFRARDPDESLQVRYVFDRVTMGSLGEVLTGPARNGLTRVEIAYLVREHLLIGFRYRQSYEAIEHLGRSLGSRRRAQIEPAVIIRL